MYSNSIVNFQESTTILNACTKVWKLIAGTLYIKKYKIIFFILDVDTCVEQKNYCREFVRTKRWSEVGRAKIREPI